MVAHPSVPNSSSIAIRDNADLEQAKHREIDAHIDTNDGRENQSEHTLRAWLTIGGSSSVFFVSFGYMNSFGYFQEFYGRGYLPQSPPSIIAFIGSLQLGLMYVTGPYVGVLFDSYGPKWLYLFGAVGTASSCLALSFCHPGQIWQFFLSQGVLFGLTVPFGVQVAISVAGQSFKQNRALAMGIVAGASSAGGVCLPIMFAHLVPRIGFAWTMRATALLFLVGYGLGICLTYSPQAVSTRSSKQKIFDFGGFRDARYAVLALANVIGNLGLYAPYYYAEPLLKLYQPESTITSYLLPMLNGCSFFGRIIGGLAADRIGGLNVLYPSVLLCAVASLGLWFTATTESLTVAFVCIYGVFISVVSPVVAHLSPDDKIGARLGAFYSLSAISVFTGTPIAGAFLQEETRGEYQYMIGYCGATMGCAGLLILLARVLCDRRMLAKW